MLELDEARKLIQNLRLSRNRLGEGSRTHGNQILTDNQSGTVPDSLLIYSVIPEERSNHELQVRFHAGCALCTGSLDGTHLPQLAERFFG